MICASVLWFFVSPSITVQEAIFRVVAAILHLGNIEFTKGQEIDSSVPKDEKSWFHLRTAAELFMWANFASLHLLKCKLFVRLAFHILSMWHLWFIIFFRCNAKALEDSLCKRVIVTRDETITKWLDPEAAALSRDALAKIVYTRLFDW